MILQTKISKSFFPFKFVFTKICVAIRLAGDKQGWVAHSFDYPLVYVVLKSLFFVYLLDKMMPGHVTGH